MLIGIISTGFITQSFYRQLLINRATIQDQLIQNTDSGIALLRGLPDSNIPLQKIQLFSDSNDSVSIKKMTWGCYPLLYATSSFSRNNQIQSWSQTCLLGFDKDTIAASSLYLTNHQHKLIVSGNTIIDGPIYISEKGIATDNMVGIPFNGVIPDDTSIKRSKFELPKYNEQLTQELKKLIALSKNPSSYYEWPDSLVNSFGNQTIVSHDEITIVENQYLEGNIILTADSLIFVRQNAVLENIILSAPYIIVEAGFKGKLQAFASQYIDIQAGAKLDYPSVIFLEKEQTVEEPLFLSIDSTAHIQGLVACIDKTDHRKRPRFKIYPNATITGELFSTDLISLEGNVYGTVITPGFSLQKGMQSFRNYLLNAHLSTSPRSEYFLQSLFRSSSPSDTKILQWIHSESLNR